MGLKERNIETKVSSRLGQLQTGLTGRSRVNNRYHLDEGKVGPEGLYANTFALNLLLKSLTRPA
jgi:hypothetical protein